MDAPFHEHPTDRGAPFRDHLQLAELATVGVMMSLLRVDPWVASALQPLAAGAWGLVDGSADPGEVLEDALRARARLRLAAGADGARAFVEDAIEHLERLRGRPAPDPEGGP